MRNLKTRNAELETRNFPMKPSELKNRTRKFSVQMIKLVEKLPKTLAGQGVAEPLVKAGLTVGAKYRQICQAATPSDFLHRIGQCEEAADECVYWLSVIVESEMLAEAEITPHRDEARKLRRILTKSRKAAAKRQRGETYRKGPGLSEDDIPF